MQIQTDNPPCEYTCEYWEIPWQTPWQINPSENPLTNPLADPSKRVTMGSRRVPRQSGPILIYYDGYYP